MFDDFHPSLVAGFCGAVISIILSKVIGVFYVYYKHQEVVESLRVLDDRLRPVLNRMAEYDRGNSWTQALDDAKSMIPVSWYNVRNILKLHEKINAPTSDIYSIVKVAQLVAAEATCERVQGEWEWVSINRMGKWECRKVRVSHQRPPTPPPTPPPTSLPPYATNALPNCPANEGQMEYVALLYATGWEWFQIGVPRAEDWGRQWVAVVRSGEWEWQWCRVPPPGRRRRVPPPVVCRLAPKLGCRVPGAGPVCEHVAHARGRGPDRGPAPGPSPVPAHAPEHAPAARPKSAPRPSLRARAARPKSAPAARPKSAPKSAPATRPKSAPRHAVLPLSDSDEELSPPVPLLDEKEEEMPYHQQIHPQGLPLPPPISSHSRRRRRAGTVGEYEHVDEASASAHPHYH